MILYFFFDFFASQEAFLVHIIGLYIALREAHEETEIFRSET